jgi:hypothetical protein
VFGIYPGGAAGSVGPTSSPKPEDPRMRLAALEALRPAGQPFVVHLYAGFTGPGGYTAAQQVGQEISQYEAAGLEVELVLTYRPTDGGNADDVQEYAQFVRDSVKAFGPNPDFVSMQITNEANIAGAPNASDGYYHDAEDALIAAVIAAKQEIQGDGHTQVKVGFNWAYSDSGTEAGFWSYLARHGGHAFRSALDWVGLDVYPGTWGPPLVGDLANGTTLAIDRAVAALRAHMLEARIGFDVPLHISENGYPTGAGRTPAMQVVAMTAAVRAVVAGRTRFNISDYRWFDLRDADTASNNFESAYGLMTDTYAPKPAFDVYRQLVARYS